MADASPDHARITGPVFHTLEGLVEEMRAAGVRILAYLCGLTMLALVAADMVSRLYDDADMAPQVGKREIAWRPAERPQPVFSVAGGGVLVNSSDKAMAYDILRHPKGGRKDVLRWPSAAIGNTEAGVPSAAIQIYRPGGELTAFSPVRMAIVDQAAAWGPSDTAAAGLIETKFGAIALVTFQAAAADGRRFCTGFVQTSEEPLLQISGWTCRDRDAGSHAAGEHSWLAQRQSVACLLNRLTLLGAGNDAKLAGFFARAELKRRSDCGGELMASADLDWITTADRPQLRGAAH
jgi:hypothetical protein